MKTFEQFPWIEKLKVMTDLGEENIHFSPSLEFENLETTHAVSIPIIEYDRKIDFFIFYRRPKAIKLLGLFKKQMDKYLSDITDQTKEEVARFLAAFLDDRYEFLEVLMKKK